MKAMIAPALGFFAAALMWASPASADDAYSQCIDHTSTNPEWAGCGEAYLRRLDSALNAAWKKANASVDGQSRKDLLAEQRAWLKFRDSSCLFWANGSYGREGQVLHFYGCRAAVIEARISALKGIYELMHQDEQ
jgi:uncharacterized protein YecT (DUF1311 family)